MKSKWQISVSFSGMYGVYFRICKNISIHTHTHICVYIYTCIRGFPGCSDGKESAWNAGDLDSIPGLGWSPGKEKGYPLQYSCLESSMDRGAWRVMVRGIAESDTTEQLKQICVYVCVYVYVWMYICICIFLLSCIYLVTAEKNLKFGMNTVKTEIYLTPDSIL